MSITTSVIESHFINDGNSPKPRRDSAGYRYHYHSQDISFFQICQSCFWCASALHETRMIKICPVCTSEEIDSLPISPNVVMSSWSTSCPWFESSVAVFAAASWLDSSTSALPSSKTSDTILLAIFLSSLHLFLYPQDYLAVCRCPPWTCSPLS